MFSEKDIKLFYNNYFNCHKMTDYLLMLQSKKTGHYWIIQKKQSDTQFPYWLYHKHTINDSYHHLHLKAKSLTYIRKQIIEHDKYVLTQKKTVQ